MNFTELWNNYPQETKIEQGCKHYSNQCAIKLSRALSKSAFALDSNYKDPTCSADGVRHARGAESLANHLWRTLARPRIFKTPATAKQNLILQKGIIFFKDISQFRGGIGDHIDLWNGFATKGNSYFDRCREIWFWLLK